MPLVLQSAACKLSTMKFTVTFLILLFAHVCYAQNELFINTSAGWKVGYNEMLRDKPLPEGLVKHTRWSGFSSACGLEYKFSPHWSVHFQVKTATVNMAIKAKSVYYDNINNQYLKDRGGVGSSSNSHAPAHIQLGGTYYSDPLKKKKFTWLVGGGIAYLINRDGFTPGIDMNTPVIRPGSSAIDYGKFIGFSMEEEFHRNGILVNIHCGLDFKFAPKHHLLLTLQHNTGLKYIWQYKANYFYYTDNFTNQTEHFNVKLRTKGSYTALQLGYKYALFGHKKS
jgi:hypothetical protein